MPSARVICPHCQAKLRLSTDGGPPTRAKCHKCGRTFTPKFDVEVKAGALYLDASVNATPITGPSPLRVPGPAPAAPLTPPPPPRTVLPPPAAPTVVVAAPPPPPSPVEEAPSPPVGWSSGNESAAAVLAPPAPPAPPLPAPPARDLSAPVVAAVARKRGDSRRQAALDAEWNDRGIKTHEVILAVAILLGAAAGAGLLWYHKYGGSLSTTADQAATDPAADEAAAADQTPIDYRSSLEAETKPRPAELIGTWELRADDGRSGSLILGADGSLHAESKSYSEISPDYHGHWYLLQQDGDHYVLEFGTAHRSLDAYRIRIQLTGPDAFTLLETVKATPAAREGHRFVRMNPPAEK